jgi:hypothetical protein
MYPQLTQKSVLTNTITTIYHIGSMFVDQTNMILPAYKKDDTDERIYMHEYFGLLGHCIKPKWNVFSLLSSPNIYLEGIVSF